MIDNTMDVNPVMKIQQKESKITEVIHLESVIFFPFVKLISSIVFFEGNTFFKGITQA